MDPAEFAAFGQRLVEVITKLKASHDALSALLKATEAERDALKKQLDELLGKVMPPESLQRLQTLVAEVESLLK